MKILLVSTSESSNTNGVDRFVGMFMQYLGGRSDIDVVWLQLYSSNEVLFVRTDEFSGSTRIRIPLPVYGCKMSSVQYWAKKFYHRVVDVLGETLPDFIPDIIHINYLGPIHLAVALREKYGSRIVTHLHYLPWKVTLNRDEHRFNRLYKIMHAARPNPEIEKLYSAEGEKDAFTYSDAVICVTDCARDYVEYICPKSKGKVKVIPNGLSRICLPKDNYSYKDSFKLLFVGTVLKSKGLNYILEAMRLVRAKGYNVSLMVAGYVLDVNVRSLKAEFSDIPFTMLGRLSLEKLLTLYQTCDAGIIASLQEQCSYAALEMMMAGLPIITTAIDGLDEIFTDQVNALKVYTQFSDTFGLSVNIEQMSSHIIRLIESKPLRESLGKAANLSFEKEYKLETMGERIVDLFYNIIEYDTKARNYDTDACKKCSSLH